MKSLSFKLLIIFSMFSAACFLPRGNFVSHGCITDEPNKSEIVGTYIADEDTLKRMEIRGLHNPAVTPKLIFHEDGKLDAVNMPDWWVSNGESNKSVEPLSSGHWQFFSYQNGCLEVLLDLPLMTPTMNLLKSRFDQHPKYVMTRYIGDPDSGNLMVFVKE